MRVLYLDYGNTEVVSWWDCHTLYPVFSFPPLVLPVRLDGLQPPGRETDKPVFRIRINKGGKDYRRKITPTIFKLNLSKLH